jgi:hypothetical protein
MPIPNPKRGDVVLTLVHPVSGDPYPVVLRPSFDAIAAIESRTAPASIFRILSDMVERRDLSVSVAAACLWAGVNARLRDDGQANQAITYEHAGAALFATPVQVWMSGILDFLTNCTSTPDNRKAAGENLGNGGGGV